MVTSVHSSTNAFEFKENSLRARLPLNADQHNEARLKLIHVLQTTLNLEEVFELFFKHLQSSVPVTGMRYNNEQQEYSLLLGREMQHHCDYRMITQNEELGNIVFSRGKRFSEHDLATIEYLLSTLVYPLRNALHYRQAVQTALNDPLTGAGNRISMDKSLHRELMMAQRYGQALSLLVIDIDHFKRVNDNYGHSFGDSMLQHIAKAIVQVTRSTDMTFRYGGEEFVVILSKTNLQGAAVIAERIRELVANLVVKEDNRRAQTTVSIGVSTLNGDESAKSLFIRADEALYRAKRKGRNCVELATEPANNPTSNNLTALPGSLTG